MDEARGDQIIDNFNNFLKQWQNISLFKHSDRNNELLKIHKAQNPYWMANSLLGFGTGTMPCLRDKLAEIVIPTLLFAGEFDSKFIRINQVMEKEFPSAELIILPESGHRAHSNAYFKIAEHLKLFIEKHKL